MEEVPWARGVPSRLQWFARLPFVRHQARLESSAFLDQWSFAHRQWLLGMFAMRFQVLLRNSELTLTSASPLELGVEPKLDVACLVPLARPCDKAREVSETQHTSFTAVTFLHT